MALTSKSLFLYGFEIKTTNRSIDFKTTTGGPEIFASLTLGFYSLTELLLEIERAMEAAAPSYSFTATVLRTADSGTGNRVTISSTAPNFRLLFQTGTRVASSTGPLLGFLIQDYIGGSSYQGSLSAGLRLVTDYTGYSYQPPETIREIQGAVSISASGVKESLVFQVQQFLQITFQHEPKAKVVTQWVSLIDWMIKQRLFEFTPDVSEPNTFYEVTLETSSRGQRGLGFLMKEMLPQFPNYYSTGQMTMRRKVSTGDFILP